MFFNYPAEATQHNWVHECLFEVSAQILSDLNLGKEPVKWPDLLPKTHREALRRKTALKNRFKVFLDRAETLSNELRIDFIAILERENNIAELLDGSAERILVVEELKPLYESASDIFEEGFELLKKTGIRDAHYESIWGLMENKTCPFCGLEHFDAPNLPREDLDHYLAKSIFPLAAANFLNLVPMGGRCNQRYKKGVNIIEMNGARSRAFNPYGQNYVDVSLESSNPVGDDFKPVWNLELVPDNEEANNWERVFSMRERMVESVLKPSYDKWIAELFDRFSSQSLDESIADEDLQIELELFAEYKKKHQEEGRGFLKHKVFEMISYQFRQGNVELVAMVRDALPKLLISI